MGAARMARIWGVDVSEFGVRARRGARWSVVSGTIVAIAAWALLPIAPAVAESEPVGLEEMGDYVAQDYTDEAATLPVDLIEALDRDLDLSAEEYLAQADAAEQAVDVVESIESSGIEVLGSSIEGTTLHVNIQDPADAAAVESTGAVAEVGAPEPFVLPGEPKLTADLWDGQGYVWQDGTNQYQCSVGFNGYLAATGARELVTAGHCLEGSGSIVGAVNVHNQPAPGLFNGTLGAIIGQPKSTTIRNHDTHPGYDVGRITVTNGALIAQPSVLTWGGGAAAPLSTPPSRVTGKTAAIVGASLCRSGSRTGWRCGPVVDVDYNNIDQPNGTLDINTVVAEVCSLPGDSGGSAVVGTNAVGISSWTTGGSSCAGVVYSGFFQMISPGGLESVTTAYPEWELAATVRTPVITTPAGAANPTTIQGTLADATAPSSVSLFLDGSATALATVPVSGGGAWSVNVAGVAAGLHTFTAVGNYGSWSKSVPASGYFSKGVTVDRLTGTNRFGTSIAVANEGYDAPVPVLFVTTGYNYPDALSAGPAAVHRGGPILLVQPLGLSQEEKDAIASFQPAKVIVLGGENSVSAQAMNDVIASVPPTTVVERMTGADRYATSRVIARTTFIDDGSGGSTHLFISNGGNFPDALSAGGAAATLDAPVLLVPGGLPSLPPETMTLISDLGATNIYVTGAENSVSAGIYNQLAALPGPIARLTGTNRYGTSEAINATFFPPTENRVLLATGENYPDALAGSSLAGKLGAPLYISHPSCIYPTTYNELVRLKVTHVTLLGGLPSLSANVAALKRC